MTETQAPSTSRAGMSLGVVGDRPRLHREEVGAGGEQLLDGRRRHVARREVARLVPGGGRHRRDEVIEKLFQLGRRRDVDGYRPGDFGPHLVGGGGVGDADDVGAARRPDERLRQGAAQRARDGAVGIPGHDRRLTDDEPVGQLHPEHDVGAAGFFAIVDEEGRREAAADPLAEELRLTRAAPPVGGGGSRLHAGTLPGMKGSYRRPGGPAPVGCRASLRARRSRAQALRTGQRDGYSRRQGRGRDESLRWNRVGVARHQPRWNTRRGNARAAELGNRRSGTAGTVPAIPSEVWSRGGQVSDRRGRTPAP